jgi:hypothetical protein
LHASRKRGRSSWRSEPEAANNNPLKRTGDGAAGDLTIVRPASRARVTIANMVDADKFRRSFRAVLGASEAKRTTSVLQNFRSVAMTPYLAALDRRRHHRRRPDQAKPTSSSAPIARAPSSTAESANNNSTKKKCRRWGCSVHWRCVRRH